jgi:nucleotide-binding universal stress UspA family protein
MKAIEKILVPTDLSEQAVPAYTHAQEIASKYGAIIDFVHIIPPLKYFSESLSKLGVPIDVMDEDLYPTLQKEVKHQMQELMEDYINEECRGKAIANIDRKTSSRISKIASEGGYNLIVMASKGEHDSDLLRGTTTEKVIRYSEVPVFTVDSKLSSKEVKQILLPTDGSEVSLAVLPIALVLAKTYEATITLLYVLELYGDTLIEADYDPQKTDKANVYESLVKRLQKYLDKEGLDYVEFKRGEKAYKDQFIITEDGATFSIPVNSVMEKAPSAHHGIVEYAIEHADIVTMATHGHSGLAHFFLGSTTEKVAQHLDLPVGTVRPAKEKLKD